MPLLLHLESIVSDFRHLFNQQNFALFEAFLLGFMTHGPWRQPDRPVSVKRITEAVLVVSEVSFPREMGGFRCRGCVPDEKDTTSVCRLGLRL